MVESDDGGDAPGGGPERPNRDAGTTRTLDTVFDLLRRSRRRYLLYHLYASDDGLSTLEAATEAVFRYEHAGTRSTEVERGSTPDRTASRTADSAASRTVDLTTVSPESTTRLAIRLDLHHVHIPRVVDAGFVDYDPRQGDVRLDGHASLQRWLARAMRHELHRSSDLLKQM